MANLSINVIEGGLGRVSQSFDKFTGLICYFATLPSGWSEGEVRVVTRSTSIDDSTLSAIADEYFRMSPEGTLYLGVTAATFSADIIDNLLAANGNLRVLGYASEALADFAAMTTNITALQTKADSLFDDINPARIVYGMMSNFTGSDTIADAPQQTGANRVLPVLSSLATGAAYMGMANMLGSISKLGVHQKISWIGGNPVKSAQISTSTIRTVTNEDAAAIDQATSDALSNKGYNFWRQYNKIDGVYWADFRSAEVVSNDYALGNYGRVIDKATVLTYEALAPYLDSPLNVDTNTGLLGQGNAEKFQAAVYQVLQNNMVGGLSGDDIEVSTNDQGELPRDTVYVDPNQNVLSTDTVTVQVSIIPIGSAKNIIIEIGLRNPAA